MRIYLRDIGLAKYCHKGARQLAEKHGFDWGQFRKEGIEADQLRATGDQMVIDLVDKVEALRGQQS